MDFIDELRLLSSRVEQLKDKINTEEATKTSLILPFFQILGYDVFNPLEFTPEYVADVGIKKGEKIDYAILVDGKPVILIEAKWIREPLQSHDSQLFRYYGTSPAKLAILTNGQHYRFYTDLDEANKMDLQPFMEIDLLNLREELVPELKKFHKTNLDVDSIFSTASDLKYSNAIKELLTKQYQNPDDAFVSYILSQVYPSRRTQQAIEKFTGLIKNSFKQWVNYLLTERFQSAMQNTSSSESSEIAVQAPEDSSLVEVSKITTLAIEMESYAIIKSILRSVVPPKNITFKDTESYFTVLFKNNTRKWICRLYMETAKKSFVLPDDSQRYYIDDVDDLFNYTDKIIGVAKKYAE